jgi:hypothetical protein
MRPFPGVAPQFGHVHRLDFTFVWGQSQGIAL